jgi:hypothetical protein
MAMRPIGHAMLQILQSGTAAQRAEAQRALARARRALYRILAEDDLGVEDDDAR